MFQTLLWALLVTAAVARDVFDTKTHEMMARCRAECLSQFHVVGSDNNCFDNAECWMCWDSCSLIYMNYRVWAPLCSDKHLCFPGCQEACKFRRSHSDHKDAEVARYSADPMPPPKYTYNPAEDTINFEWSIPDTKVGQKEPLVYVLLAQDQLASRWQPLAQTFYTNTTVRRGLLKSSSRIRLAAYDSEGQVGQIEQSCAAFTIHSGSDSIDAMFHDEGYLEDNSRRRHPTLDPSLDFGDHRRQWSPVLQALRHSTKHHGGIDAVLSWSRISPNADHRYEIEWKRNEQSIDITGQFSTYDNVGVVTLWPNCIYQVTVRAFTFGSHRSVADSATLIVDTAQHTSGSRPLIDSCPGCVPPQYIIGVAFIVMAAIVTVIGIVIIQGIIQRSSSKTTPKTSTPIQPNKLQPSLIRHTSVKRQLSSLSARISQGSRGSAGKHDRLIDEDTSSAFEKSPDSNGCHNV